MDSTQIQKLRYEIMDDNILFVDNNGDYNGMTMEKDHASLNWDSADAQGRKYLVEIDRWMSKYKRYVEAKGDFKKMKK